MILRELLKVMDEHTRIQIAVKMYGTIFTTGTYRSIIRNEGTEGLLNMEVIKVCSGEEDGIKTIKIYVEE